MEWAVEVALEFGLPVAATMCIGPGGDEGGVSVGECAVRMARAGAHIVGTNCLFDPYTILEVMAEMKSALDKCGLAPYLMAQPNGYRIPDGGSQVGNRNVEIESDLNLLICLSPHYIIRDG